MYLKYDRAIMFWLGGFTVRILSGTFTWYEGSVAFIALAALLAATAAINCIISLIALWRHRKRAERR